jgi:hypothetical protein
MLMPPSLSFSSFPLLFSFFFSFRSSVSDLIWFGAFGFALWANERALHGWHYIALRGKSWYCFFSAYWCSELVFSLPLFSILFGVVSSIQDDGKSENRVKKSISGVIL